MKICIIGGGLCGLSAAYHLSDQADIDILERASFLGGCLASYPVHNTWIERFYHHCFAGDNSFIDLIDRLGIAHLLEWRMGSTGYMVDGTVYPLTTPRDILWYPHLSAGDKVRLAWLTLRSKKYNLDTLDAISARDFILDTCGEHVYSAFFEPLLKSKFGDLRDQVSAAWLISRIAIRSNRGVSGERLGYLRGGFQKLIMALEKNLERKGCSILLDNPAREIGRLNGKWSVNNEQYDAVISTVAPHELRSIGAPEMPSIPYQGAACMTLGLEQDVTEGIYWLNMKDAAPYGAVIGHTNFIPRDRYGEHIVYLASYFGGPSVPENLSTTMLRDFQKRFCVSPRGIHWHHLAVCRSAGPVYVTGYREIIPRYEKNGLFLAGMFSQPNYPERSMEGAVLAGTEVAEKVGEVLTA